jgi:hypothetical protein
MDSKIYSDRRLVDCLRKISPNQSATRDGLIELIHRNRAKNYGDPRQGALHARGQSDRQ